MWPDASLGVQRTKTKDVRNSGCWTVVRQTVREKQDTVNFRVKCTLSCATLAKHAHWSAGKLKQKEVSRYKHKHARTILVTRNKFSKQENTRHSHDIPSIPPSHMTSGAARVHLLARHQQASGQLEVKPVLSQRISDFSFISV